MSLSEFRYVEFLVGRDYNFHTQSRNFLDSTSISQSYSVIVYRITAPSKLSRENPWERGWSRSVELFCYKGRSRSLWFSKCFEPRNISLFVWCDRPVRVVLKIAAAGDWCFDNLSGSHHLQTQVMSNDFFCFVAWLHLVNNKTKEIYIIQALNQPTG